jgi:hypothetical protein
VALVPRADQTPLRGDAGLLLQGGIGSGNVGSGRASVTDEPLRVPDWGKGTSWHHDDDGRVEI